MLYLIYFQLLASSVCNRFHKEFGPFSGNRVTYHSLKYYPRFSCFVHGLAFYADFFFYVFQNAAPGLQVFQPPMAYAETDPDFHLCPLPRYTQTNPANPHMATQRPYLDREVRCKRHKPFKQIIRTIPSYRLGLGRVLQKWPRVLAH